MTIQELQEKVNELKARQQMIKYKSIIVLVFAIVIGIPLTGIIPYYFWNQVISPLTGMGAITFWQAILIGLFIAAFKGGNK